MKRGKAFVVCKTFLEIQPFHVCLVLFLVVSVTFLKQVPIHSTQSSLLAELFHWHLHTSCMCVNHITGSSTKEPLPVFYQDLCQSNDFLVCAVLPDTIHGHADPRFLKQTRTSMHIMGFNCHALVLCCMICIVLRQWQGLNKWQNCTLRQTKAIHAVLEPTWRSLSVILNPLSSLSRSMAPSCTHTTHNETMTNPCWTSLFTHT